MVSSIVPTKKKTYQRNPKKSKNNIQTFEFSDEEQDMVKSLTKVIDKISPKRDVVPKIDVTVEAIVDDRIKHSRKRSQCTDDLIPTKFDQNDENAFISA